MTKRAMTFEMSHDYAGEIAVFESSVSNPTFAQLNKLDSNYSATAYTYNRLAVNFLAVPSQYYFIVIDYNDFHPNQQQTGNFQLKFYQSKMRYSSRLLDRASLNER